MRGLDLEGCKPSIGVYGQVCELTSEPLAMSKRAEFWLWWFTDECGRRRRTPFRMSREDALKRYPDAEPIAGTLKIRSLSGRWSACGGLVRKPEAKNRVVEKPVAAGSNS